jgi:hypothetical protein
VFTTPRPVVDTNILSGRFIKPGSGFKDKILKRLIFDLYWN